MNCVSWVQARPALNNLKEAKPVSLPQHGDGQHQHHHLQHQAQFRERDQPKYKKKKKNGRGPLMEDDL